MFEKTLNELIRGIRAHPDTEVLTHSLSILDWKCVKLIRLACVVCVCLRPNCGWCWVYWVASGLADPFSMIFQCKRAAPLALWCVGLVRGCRRHLSVVFRKEKNVGFVQGLVLPRCTAHVVGCRTMGCGCHATRTAVCVSRL